MIINLVILIFLLSFAYAAWRGAPWVPTKNKDWEEFIKLVDIQPGQKFYDLGCGDGRVLFTAAKTGAEAYGLELSLFLVLTVYLRRLFFKDRKKIHIWMKDFWKTNLSEADIVYFFLIPSIYPKLKVKLEKELKPGAKIIAYAWGIEGWQPLATSHFTGRPNFFLYQKK